MKAAITLIAICTVICQTVAFSKEERLKFREECLKEAPLSEDVLKSFKAGKPEFTEDVNKFLFCMSKHFGGQNEDGSFNVEKQKENLGKFLGPESAAKIDECTATDLHDGPANAGAFAKCMAPLFLKHKSDVDA